MRTQTKCTLAICGLFIIEILPVPISSVYSLYVVRKRPNWLPDVVDRLYADKPAKDNIGLGQPLPAGHDPMETRKNCTIALLVMFAVDLLIPVVIPTALYVVRRRPYWFKNLVARLYYDQLAIAATEADEKLDLKIESPEILEEIEKRYADLERMNLDYAKFLSKKQRRGHFLSR